MLWFRLSAVSLVHTGHRAGPDGLQHHARGRNHGLEPREDLQRSARRAQRGQLRQSDFALRKARRPSRRHAAGAAGRTGKSLHLLQGNEQAQALAVLDRFMRLHPASPALDYAIYLKGLVNFNDNLGLFGSLGPARPVRARPESGESLFRIVPRGRDALPRLQIRARLARAHDLHRELAGQFEVHVARYYYKRGAYLAAINRAQVALTDYANAPALEEALYILMKSYDALGMTQLRDDAQRVMQANYPNSRFLTDGRQDTRRALVEALVSSSGWSRAPAPRMSASLSSMDRAASGQQSTGHRIGSASDRPRPPAPLGRFRCGSAGQPPA